MRKRLTAAGSVRREIPDDYKYNKKKIKHLQHVLHNVNVALGTLVSALNEFSRVKGPDISPDGMLGGLGYILPIKDIKEALNNSVKGLSDIADSIADELTNPHWESEDDAETKKVIKEKEEVEEQVEEAEQAVPEDAAPEDENIWPQDIVTSREFDTSLAKMASEDKPLTDVVRKNLVRFSSVGTQKTISKEQI